MSYVPLSVPLSLKSIVQVSNVRYFKLDLSQTLASQLQHKTVIEFPDLLVLLPEQKADYKLIGEESSGRVLLMLGDHSCVGMTLVVH